MVYLRLLKPFQNGQNLYQKIYFYEPILYKEMNSRCQIDLKNVLMK
jgi:hypothetical protein